MFEASAVNSKIVSAALSGVYKAMGAKASSRALYAQPRKSSPMSS